MDNKEIANIFKALSDERRIKILNLLQDGELCACNLLERLDMVQSGLSYHMKILVESNLVVCRNEGKWSHYSLNMEGKESVKKILDSLFINNNTEIKCNCKK
ncbi:MAG: ArsR/SmtB family transcription factor [Pleomorphochaeta sp.]